MKESRRFAISSDLISEMLTGMRLRGVQYRRIQTGPSFGLSFQAKPGYAYFHYLAVGTALLRTADGTQLTLSAGSAVFIPQGIAHQLLSDEHVACQEINAFYAEDLGDAVSGVDTCPSTHSVPSAVLFYGCMAFDLGGMYELITLMPKLMVAETIGGKYPDLVAILDAMKREICSGRIGFAGILARLAEVGASMIVRGWVEEGGEDASGLISALRDPRLAPALLAMHRYPSRRWTVSELAAESYISRSVFAQRFQETMGIPPLQYLIQLRMRLAAQWLARESISIDTVAQRLGYTSQAAFSRAFKRTNGHPPSASRHASISVG